MLKRECDFTLVNSLLYSLSYLLIMHYTCYLDITHCFLFKKIKVFITTCRAKLTENVSRARDHVLRALSLNDHESSG